MVAQNGSCSFLDISINLDVEDAQTYGIPQAAYQHAHASNWGSTYTALLLDWLQSLKWSKQYDKQSNGISWFEFAVNFVLTTQRNITVSVRQKHETKRYVSTIEDPAFDISTFTMVDVTNSFRAVGNIYIFSFSNLRRTIDTALFFLCLYGQDSAEILSEVHWYSASLAAADSSNL